MSQDQGTPPTLADAVAAARAEIADRGEPDPFTNEVVEPPASGQEDGTEVENQEVLEPAGEDQAPSEAGEQATEVLDGPDDEDSEQSDELFADLAEETPEEGQEPEAPAAQEAPEAHEVPGFDEPVPVQELINGYLRQSDYTRKTQEVARDRERLAKAEEFYMALTQHPKELATQLAAAAGLIEPGAQPLKVVDLPFRPAEEVDAEVERRVQETLESHPELEEARNILALQKVEQEFSAIEETIGKPIGPKSRRVVLEEAVRRGTDDLRLVFDALMQRQQEKSRTAEQRKRSAPVKPTGKASTSTVTAEPETPLDAVAKAAEEAGVDIDLSQLNFR